MQNQKLFTLDSSGVTVILDPLPVSATSIAIIVKAGTRDENEAISGAAHFLEHMAFKGTKTHTKEQIDRQIDLWGCMANAETSKNYTMYYCKVPSSETEKALELFYNMAFEGTLPEEGFKLEKGVILQEISMCEDEPDHFIFDKTMKLAYPGQMLGEPTLGTRHSINNMTNDDLFRFREENYSGSRTAIVISGGLDEKKITDLCTKLSQNLKPGAKYEPNQINFKDGYYAETRKQEQLKLMLCYPTDGGSSQDKYSTRVLSAVLGSGFSSRLFQEVREKRGLAYSVGSTFAYWDNGGLFEIYAGLDPKKISQSLTVIGNELYNVRNALRDEEVTRAKTMITSAILLATDDTIKRAKGLALDWVSSGKVTWFDEIVININQVTTNNVASIAKSIFKRNYISVATGDVSSVPHHEHLMNALNESASLIVE